MAMFGSVGQPQLLDLIKMFSTPQNQQGAGVFGMPAQSPGPINVPMQPDAPPAIKPVDVNLFPNGMPRVPKPSLFGKDGNGWKVLGILGDALQTAGGGRPTYMPYLQEQQKLQQEHDRLAAQQALEQRKLDWQIKKDSRDVRTVGRSLLSVPVDGDPSIIYTAPTDAESFAQSIGINPGDPQYVPTIKDKELGAYGPTAFDQKKELEDQRFGNRQTLRGMPTYANLHPQPRGGGGNAGPRVPRSVGEAIAPIIVKLRNGQPLTASDQQALSYYGPGRGRRPFTPSAAPAPSRAPVRVSSPDEARKLAPGTVFMTPDGRTKVR